MDKRGRTGKKGTGVTPFRRATGGGGVTPGDTSPGDATAGLVSACEFMLYVTSVTMSVLRCCYLVSSFFSSFFPWWSTRTIRASMQLWLSSIIVTGLSPLLHHIRRSGINPSPSPDGHRSSPASVSLVVDHLVIVATIAAASLSFVQECIASCHNHCCNSPACSWIRRCNMFHAARPLHRVFTVLLSIGVTKVGVTRCGNWWCHTIFVCQKSDDLSFVSLSLLLPSNRFSSILCKFSRQKL